MRFRDQDKKKAITFSYDDGLTQDIALIELLNKYNLKCTFNLNSELLGTTRILEMPKEVLHNGQILQMPRRMAHYKIHPQDVRYIYEGHEIAVHTLTHPSLASLEEAEIIRQVEQDRLNLSELAGYEVVGMAYPNGSYDDRVARIIEAHTGVRYARTTVNTKSFAPQENLYQYHPTVFHVWDFAELMHLGETLIEMQPDTPQIFCIWGHSHELDTRTDWWPQLEEFFKLISNRDDIFYGTNAEVLL